MVKRPDEPTSAEERARAASLARRLDALLAGEGLPPALEAEERALLETAIDVRSLSPAAGAPGAVSEPVRRVLDGIFPPSAPPAASAPLRITRPRSFARRAPWLVAAACAAAAAFFALRGPSPSRPGAEAGPEARRPSFDALVGPIPRERAAEARDRIDLVYADRLAGFRAARLGGAR